MKAWRDQCPNRSAGLDHAHRGLCEGNHSPKHALNQCCHCGAFMQSSVNTASTADEKPIPVPEPQRRTKPSTEKPGDLDDEDKGRIWFYLNFCRPKALEREPVEPMGEYASLFRKEP